MFSLHDAKLSRRTVLRGLGASLALPFVAATSNQGLCQLDPGARNYVLNTFKIGVDSLQVLVAKAPSHGYLAGKEYWSVHQHMLKAVASATPGTAMSIVGTSHDWPAPKGFSPTFRMQDAVTWSTSAPPPELSWVYSDVRSNTYVCIAFALEGRHRRVASIKWYLAAARAPRTGTYVFPDGPTYSLLYTRAPTLPTDYSWFGVTVYPGS